MSTLYHRVIPNSLHPYIDPPTILVDWEIITLCLDQSMIELATESMFLCLIHGPEYSKENDSGLYCRAIKCSVINLYVWRLVLLDSENIITISACRWHTRESYMSHACGCNMCSGLFAFPSILASEYNWITVVFLYIKVCLPFRPLEQVKDGNVEEFTVFTLTSNNQHSSIFSLITLETVTMTSRARWWCKYYQVQRTVAVAGLMEVCSRTLILQGEVEWAVYIHIPSIY